MTQKDGMARWTTFAAFAAANTAPTAISALPEKTQRESDATSAKLKVVY